MQPIQKQKSSYQNYDNDGMVFLRKLSLLVFFSPILYGLLITFQLTNEKNYPARNLARHFGILHYSSGLPKVTELIRYSQAVNVAFIKHTYILIYIFIYIIYIATCIYLYINTMLHILCIVAFIMFLCFSKTVQSFYIKFLQMLLVLRGQPPIQKSFTA